MWDWLKRRRYKRNDPEKVKALLDKRFGTPEPVAKEPPSGEPFFFDPAGPVGLFASEADEKGEGE